MEEQKDECLKRLERMLNNTDTGMTRERYLEMCEQIGNEPIQEEIPPDIEDFPSLGSVLFKEITRNGLSDP